MEDAIAPRKPGPRLKDPAKRKITLSLTLTPVQRANLEQQAQSADMTPSELIIKKLKL